MLVMHELHHVLLGHTTLFPRVTRIQNFVFDAVINGIVCRMFPEKDHTAFFTDYYDAGEIGRAHVRTTVTNAHLVCRLLLEKNKVTYIYNTTNLHQHEHLTQHT